MITSNRFVFHWPDPQEPKIITRDLTVLRDRTRSRKGEPKPAPLMLRGIKLIELVAHCLYEVPVDCHELAKDVRALRSGCILSRNLKVSERLNKGSIEEEWKQCFISYDGIFKARRGVGHVDRRYRSCEILANRKLAGTLDELVRTSWELHKVDDDGREAFVLIAVTAAKEYGKPIDETKQRAQARALQAGTIADKTGRPNPGRIPLICFAGEHEIASRIQTVRGIGRRMSFREVVLEHYIDRLREIVLDVSRSQQYRLRDEWLAPTAWRTPKKVREEADRLERAAKRLRAIVTRPFSRSFSRSADDLDTAAQLMREAADDRNGIRIARVKEIIGQVFRATVQLECHWRMEEILLQLGILEDRGENLDDSRKRRWHVELRAIHHKLVSVEPFTNQRLEHGFKGPVLPRVVPHVHLADTYLMRVLSQGGPDLESMKEELNKAVEPL
ncbi:hypothetical protein EPN81_04600 [Patescibacteria group bacterium]|nr:MAG: hypothetical protein EPN81_04600 [Patescibacteria group bacterium]